MARRGDLLLMTACAIVALIMLRMGVGQIYIFAIVTLMVLALPAFFGKAVQTYDDSRYGHELEEPFLAEVLLDGKPVARITDRVFTEMFWRDYKIAPLTPELEDVVMNDDLWEACRFTFRDPASRKVCLAGFCGGSRPYVRGGVISLRALYFLPEDKALEQTASSLHAPAAPPAPPPAP